MKDQFLETKAKTVDYPFRPIVQFRRLLVQAKLQERNSTRIFAWYAKLLLFEPFRLIEGMCTWAMNTSSTKVIQPVFILGHWRSGTTYLQTLLAQHPSFAYLNMFKAIFPGSYWLTEPWLKPILQWLAKVSKQQNHFHQRPLNWEEGQEEDLGLMSMVSPHTPYWGRMMGRSKGLLSIDPNAWEKDHTKLLQKLQWRFPKKRLILKSPPNILFLPKLLEHYPDAQFIFIYRNPIEVYHSMQKLWKANLKHHAFCPISSSDIHQAILEDYDALMQAYLQYKKILPSQQLWELDYKELRDHEARELGMIWKFLREKSLQQGESNSAPFIPKSYPQNEALELELRETWGRYFDLPNTFHP